MRVHALSQMAKLYIRPGTLANPNWPRMCAYPAEWKQAECHRTKCNETLQRGGFPNVPYANIR